MRVARSWASCFEFMKMTDWPMFMHPYRSESNWNFCSRGLLLQSAYLHPSKNRDYQNFGNRPNLSDHLKFNTNSDNICWMVLRVRSSFLTSMRTPSGTMRFAKLRTSSG